MHNCWEETAPGRTKKCGVFRGNTAPCRTRSDRSWKMTQDTTKTGYNCKGEKGTGPYRKQLRCLAEKRNRAEQKGEQLMRGNRQPAGPTKRVHNFCGKNGAEADKQRWSWLMENRKN
ncbi:hypothetical protein T11_16076 [Trichinella zimbabwensis]|uniref:Uncharacterized protein n=1 Tax=Trichinella zimbabwensis TaxID=268475 RepID=A0A0V1GIY6_9BILA|nr:hypothetical protein T11_16076 [Trichinella zimbabwensis]